jgi:hypothetical protein
MSNLNVRLHKIMVNIHHRDSCYHQNIPLDTYLTQSPPTLFVITTIVLTTSNILIRIRCQWSFTPKHYFSISNMKISFLAFLLLVNPRIMDQRDSIVIIPLRSISPDYISQNSSSYCSLSSKDLGSTKWYQSIVLPVGSRP